ncbi:hypothetical protein B0T11DRAFT_298906 [Plectosphaerella cucumerina]|uniref:Uncharacterized protein n=1 Tax=Plectosphaerella cucumerina TaxID=40658 RepID=A0A8K0X2F1_9PEZI|nr:hypothetical protein B0T11DRAFT_298906 [Plectosphaerella cucumerina]
MRFSPILLTVSGLAAGARTIRRDGTDPADVVVSTKKFIVEVDPAADRDDLVKELEATPGCRVTKGFDSAIFSGVPTAAAAAEGASAPLAGGHGHGRGLVESHVSSVVLVVRREERRRRVRLMQYQETARS